MKTLRTIGAVAAALFFTIGLILPTAGATAPMPRDNAAIVAASLLDAEQWDDARILFGTLAGWFPDAPQVYDSLAHAYWRRGDVKGAQEKFRRALELQPGFSSGYSANDYGLAGS